MAQGITPFIVDECVKCPSRFCCIFSDITREEFYGKYNDDVDVDEVSYLELIMEAIVHVESKKCQHLITNCYFKHSFIKAFKKDKLWPKKK